ncbi:MAG: hypothetical protein MZV64_15550 [Ignavibacteriales bacterium]|nr:hypothetical protein [Ignavibacteriales bacterium]
MQLDPRLYPQRDDLTPEQEFREFIKPIPRHRSATQRTQSLCAISCGLTACNIPRITSSATVLRCLLMRQASLTRSTPKDLYVTHAQIFLIADLLIKAKADGRLFSRMRLLRLNRSRSDYINMHDRLGGEFVQVVAQLQAYGMCIEVLWLLGAYLEYLRLVTNRFRANGDRDEYISTHAGAQTGGRWLSARSFKSRKRSTH